MRILAFGHIPKHRGGKQHSGLANAMWSIAESLNASGKGMEVVFCATDIYVSKININGVPVIGWTTLSLIRSIVLHPLTFISVVMKTALLYNRFRLPVIRSSLRAMLLKSSMAQVDPDYIHLHNCECVLYLVAGIVPPHKTIVTIHGVHGESGGLRLSFMERALSAVPLKALVFVTQKNEAEWISLYGNTPVRTASIPNAYDHTIFFRANGLPKRKGGRKSHFHLISVGSIGQNKGQIRVLDSIVALYAGGCHYTVSLTLVGKGDVLTVKSMQEKALESSIDLHIYDYLPPELLRAQLAEADFMILPSHNEGFGLVFLESIACGVPVVLPGHLAICSEPNIIKTSNSVILKSSTADAVLDFLKDLPIYEFVDVDVAESLPLISWESVGRRYGEMFE